MTATETGHMRQALRHIKLSRAGDIPLEVDSPSFREAQLGPAGVAFTHAVTTIATDGAVKDDGRMGAAYVALGSRIPPRSFVVLGPPSSMRAELSAIDQAVADAPEQEELNILTDSLSSIIKLANMQRRDFPEWLHGHPEKVLLESVCKRINARAQARMMTRIIKVPAHRAHALNEAADAAACAAAEEADPESVTLSHADSNAVRFYLHDALTEWGACVRNHLIQTTAQQHAKRLQLTLARHVNESPVANNAAGPHRHRSKVSFAAQWLLRSGQGRNFLGAAMASMRNGARKRRLLQTIAGVFPCRALLYKWGKTPSPQCLLCNQEAETLAHIQCWCPKLKEARIAAHHAIAACLFGMLQKHSAGCWQIISEVPVSGLRAITVPLDLYNMWNRMVDDLEDPGSQDVMQGTDHQQELSRLLPDGWAISWSLQQVLLLELTRAYDWRCDWHISTDLRKIQRYQSLQERMTLLLPPGWTVEIVPVTIGIRGSFEAIRWSDFLARFGMTTEEHRDRFMRVLIPQVLEELDRMYGVRSEALRRLQNDLHARRS